MITQGAVGEAFFNSCCFVALWQRELAAAGSILLHAHSQSGLKNTNSNKIEVSVEFQDSVERIRQVSQRVISLSFSL